MTVLSIASYEPKKGPCVFQLQTIFSRLCVPMQGTVLQALVFILCKCHAYIIVLCDDCSIRVFDCSIRVS